MKKIILLSNDDGVEARGIKVLMEGLADLGTLYVVAPSDQMSGSSHSITLGREIEVIERGERIYAVRGTPADCTLIALFGLLPRKPDLVISGINLGYNLGEDVFYSGTVAAAREGALYGVRAMSVSIEDVENPRWETALYFAKELAKRILRGELGGRLLNVNIPSRRLEDIKGIRFTRLGTRSYRDPVERVGSCRFKIGGEPMWKWEEGTDLEAVGGSFVSVTPLKVDLTDYEVLHELE
ncbi:MAG: 5'/3'-nucleotidase SurE [Candidatus Hydrothermae bacterium]|nr:5'/3'-nucleotidase SurE [Candidatus Hydrothermae bacterium]